MPLPKPKPNENKDDFLKRCMANSTMNQEYPDHNQRYAVCNNLWRKKSMEIGLNDQIFKQPFQPINEYWKDEQYETALLKFAIKKVKPNLYLFIGTDETIDRDEEVIKVDGWVLKYFKVNNVVLWGHQHGVPAIAVSEKTYVKDNKIHFMVRFATEGIYELADTVHGLVEDNIIKAVSVGYIPLAREYPTDEDKKSGKKPRVITTKAELYELSIVNVGANRNALREAMVSKGYDEKAINLITEEEQTYLKGHDWPHAEPTEEMKEDCVLSEKDLAIRGLLETMKIKIDSIYEFMKNWKEDFIKHESKSKYDRLLGGSRKDEKPPEEKQNPFHIVEKKQQNIFKRGE